MIRTLLSVALLVVASRAAWAQGVEELQRMIKERDAKIRELTERIDALERKKTEPEDEEMNRALERALVQQGGLLLRAPSYELQPELSYAHWDKSRGLLRHESEAALSLRAGLPWESQVQVRVPYVHLATAAGSATGLGDIGFSLSKQFVRESGFLPGLVGSLGWLSRTGKDGFDGGVPTGGGFNVPQAGLTAVKRADPLVFYGGVSYAAPRARQIAGSKVDPGDTTGLRFGSILAASPETSVNVGLNLGFVSTTRVDGQPVPDSDTVLGTLQIGFGSILTRRVMLNVSGEFRVSGSVPNFRLTATLPIRF